MNDDLRQRITRIFESVDGGSSTDMMQMLDVAIEDGEITQEEWQTNETEICTLFDAGWFTCNGCGWTMPIGDMAYSVPDGEDDWVCSNCAEENYGESDD